MNFVFQKIKTTDFHMVSVSLSKFNWLVSAIFDGLKDKLPQSPT